jgi:hypothetical protein
MVMHSQTNNPADELTTPRQPGAKYAENQQMSDYR